jgi:hypothetical protein
MKYLGGNKFNFTEEEMFNLQINSISGCKVKVGDEYYSVWKEGVGNCGVKYNKFQIDFELTEEELKKLIIKDD